MEDIWIALVRNMEMGLGKICILKTTTAPTIATNIVTLLID
ncbi:hypothetical protein OPIT5_04845 [Opitutaceae bacterium TAV5]|nr:hypothetical protein OPIT5_04845 [Opitutaceae bacterium TAV5]